MRSLIAAVAATCAALSLAACTEREEEAVEGEAAETAAEVRSDAGVLAEKTGEALKEGVAEVKEGAADAAAMVKEGAAELGAEVRDETGDARRATDGK